MSKKRRIRMVTRKMSLKAAMEMLESAGKAEMAEKLGEMLAEMPCAHWTRAEHRGRFSRLVLDARPPALDARARQYAGPALPRDDPQMSRRALCAVRGGVSAPLGRSAAPARPRLDERGGAANAFPARSTNACARPPPRATTPAAKGHAERAGHRPGADARRHVGGAACAPGAHALLSAPRGDGAARAGLRRGRRIPRRSAWSAIWSAFRTTKRASRRRSAALKRERDAARRKASAARDVRRRL